MIACHVMPAILLLALLGLSHGLAYWSGQSAERRVWQLSETTRERDNNAAFYCWSAVPCLRLSDELGRHHLVSDRGVIAGWVVYS